VLTLIGLLRSNSITSMSLSNEAFPVKLRRESRHSP
jgi:hypothetical protein